MSSATLNFKIMYDVPVKIYPSTTWIIIISGNNVTFNSQKKKKKHKRKILTSFLAVNNVKRSGIEHISTISHRLNKRETKLNEATQQIDSLGLHTSRARFVPCLELEVKIKAAASTLAFL